MPVVDTFKAYGTVYSLAGVLDTADNGIDPDDCSASITIGRNGSITWTTNINGSGSYGNWITPAGTNPGDTHWVRWTSNTGTLSSGLTSGTWTQLNSDRSVTVVRTSIGSKTCKGTFDIATDSGGSNIVATKSDNDLTAIVGS